MTTSQRRFPSVPSRRRSSHFQDTTNLLAALFPQMDKEVLSSVLAASKDAVPSNTNTTSPSSTTTSGGFGGFGGKPSAAANSSSNFSDINLVVTELLQLQQQLEGSHVQVGGGNDQGVGSARSSKGKGRAAGDSQSGIVLKGKARADNAFEPPVGGELLEGYTHTTARDMTEAPAYTVHDNGGHARPVGAPGAEVTGDKLPSYWDEPDARVEFPSEAKQHSRQHQPASSALAKVSSSDFFAGPVPPESGSQPQRHGFEGQSGASRDPRDYADAVASSLKRSIESTKRINWTLDGWIPIKLYGNNVDNKGKDRPLSLFNLPRRALEAILLHSVNPNLLLASKSLASYINPSVSTLAELATTFYDVPRPEFLERCARSPWLNNDPEVITVISNRIEKAATKAIESLSSTKSALRRRSLLDVPHLVATCNIFARAVAAAAQRQHWDIVRGLLRLARHLEADLLPDESQTVKHETEDGRHRNPIIERVHSHELASQFRGKFQIPGVQPASLMDAPGVQPGLHRALVCALVANCVPLFDEVLMRCLIEEEGLELTPEAFFQTISLHRAPPPVVSYLLSHYGTDPNTTLQISGRTHVFGESALTREMLVTFVKHGLDLRADEDRILKSAVRGGRVDLVRYIIEMAGGTGGGGPSICTPECLGEGLVKWIVESGKVQMVKVLLEAGLPVLWALEVACERGTDVVCLAIAERVAAGVAGQDGVDGSLNNGHGASANASSDPVSLLRALETAARKGRLAVCAAILDAASAAASSASSTLSPLSSSSPANKEDEESSGEVVAARLLNWAIAHACQANQPGTLATLLVADAARAGESWVGVKSDGNGEILTKKAVAEPANFPATIYSEDSTTSTTAAVMGSNTLSIRRTRLARLDEAFSAAAAEGSVPCLRVLVQLGRSMSIPSSTKDNSPNATTDQTDHAGKAPSSPTIDKSVLQMALCVAAEEGHMDAVQFLCEDCGIVAEFLGEREQRLASEDGGHQANGGGTGAPSSGGRSEGQEGRSAAEAGLVGIGVESLIAGAEEEDGDASQVLTAAQLAMEAGHFGVAAYIMRVAGIDA
ncbi:hypothetical protein HK102_012264 [Quaeritorhiza haematococci]|nr:hypothetical protein HK102_012264 [Quaeritorhiza haematococci]